MTRSGPVWSGIVWPGSVWLGKDPSGFSRIGGMMARLTISIPGELATRLKPFKAAMNVSAVCAEALRREVKMRSTAARTPEALRVAVARLRASREAAG